MRSGHCLMFPGPPATVVDEAYARTVAPEDELLPERMTEDRDESWGERDAGRDDEWYLDERPPHHGD